MLVEEIFEKISHQLLKSIMNHKQLANYYDFIGLKGYKRYNEYYCLEALYEHRKLCRYYINSYGKLIPESNIQSTRIIPDGMYKYNSENVDYSTKRNIVKTTMQTLRDFKYETKKLYEDMYTELMSKKEVASAMFLGCYIKDVTNELKYIDRKLGELKATDYSMALIIPEQASIHDKYKHKLKELSEILGG